MKPSELDYFVTKLLLSRTETFSFLIFAERDINTIKTDGSSFAR
jgi:hypothetical protein